MEAIETIKSIDLKLDKLQFCFMTINVLVYFCCYVKNDTFILILIEMNPYQELTNRFIKS